MKKRLLLLAFIAGMENESRYSWKFTWETICKQGKFARIRAFIAWYNTFNHD